MLGAHDARQFQVIDIAGAGLRGEDEQPLDLAHAGVVGVGRNRAEWADRAAVDDLLLDGFTVLSQHLLWGR